MAREIITLECTECKQRNYTTKKEKRNTPGRLELKKYCKFERKHTLHRETR
jgi:large subunit ribosomal protein L33